MARKKGEGAIRKITSNDEEKPNKMTTEEDDDKEEEVWEEIKKGWEEIKEVKGEKRHTTNLGSKTKSHT